MFESKSARTYKTLNFPSAVPGSKTLLTGIRGVIGRESGESGESHKDKVYISGWYQPPESVDSTNESEVEKVTKVTKVTSFIYKGCLHGKGKWYELNYPSSPGRTVQTTNLYGPNNGVKPKEIEVVGNYSTVETGKSLLGCLYEGPLDGSGKWTTIIPKSLLSSSKNKSKDKSKDKILNTICHSTHGGLVVGNYDTIKIQGKAFIYDIENKQYYNIDKKGAKSITAYGIWHNGCRLDNSDYYTICGGYSDLDHKSGLSSAYLVNWNNKTKKLENWRSYSYNNDPAKSIITHFNGITRDSGNGFNLTGDSIGIDESSIAFFAHIPNVIFVRGSRVKHNPQPEWSEISYPTANADAKTSGNSVYKAVVIGVYPTSKDKMVNGYISELIT